MKIKLIRFLSAVLFVFLLITLYVPAFASSGTEYSQKTTLWHWIAGDGSILEDFAGYLVGAVCPNSEDGYHHSTSYLYEKDNGYYRAICSACGKKFDAYESDLKQSYDNQVSELPAIGVTSTGSLIWYPDIRYCCVYINYYGRWYYFFW